MNAVADTAVFFAKFLYYFLESLVFKVVPKRKKNVAGEIVLITGAGSGLGRLLAMHFASHGAILVLWDINQEGNMETCRLAKGSKPGWSTKASSRIGSKATEKPCLEKLNKQTNKQKIQRFNRCHVSLISGQVREEVGDVTILINNAGVVTGKPFLDIPDHMVERSFLVNSISHFWTYKAFLPAMVANNHGHLVCISSSAGLVGVNGLADYCASKFAAFGFAESVFLETFAQKQNGIKTTIVCPFLIKTGMFEGCTTK
ncbi:Short-chain dehydrogenase/reductase family 16C member 6 [Lemmus lemmus]